MFQILLSKTTSWGNTPTQMKMFEIDHNQNKIKSFDYWESTYQNESLKQSGKLALGKRQEQLGGAEGDHQQEYENREHGIDQPEFDDANGENGYENEEEEVDEVDDEEEDDEDQFEDEVDEDEVEEDEEGDVDDEQQYDLMSNIKYCNKDKQISIPMQAGFIREIMSKAQIDTSLVKHANTAEAAQDELLICLGQTLKDKLQTVWKNKKSGEIVRQLFLNICFKIFLSQLQGFIQMAMERKGCKNSLEEYLEEDERAKEAKKVKNQKKKLKQKAKKQEKRQEDQRKQEEEELKKKQEEEQKVKQKEEARQQKKILEEAQVQQKKQLLLDQANINSNTNAANGKKKKKNSKPSMLEVPHQSADGQTNKDRDQEENYQQKNNQRQQDSAVSASTEDSVSHPDPCQVSAGQGKKEVLASQLNATVTPFNKKNDLFNGKVLGNFPNSKNTDNQIHQEGPRAPQKSQIEKPQEQYNQKELENIKTKENNNNNLTEDNILECEKTLLKKMGWKEDECKQTINEIHEKEIQEYCLNKTKFDKERACYRRNLQQRFQCLIRSHCIRAK